MPNPMSDSKLAAFKIERRSIGAALFVNSKIDHTEIRHLTSNESQSIRAATGFVQWFVHAFGASSAAMETVSEASPIRRAVLSKAIIDTLRSTPVSVREVSKRDLLAAFGLPSPKTRREVREVGVTLWPILETGRAQPAVLDAAALGLLTQVERLFQSTSHFS